MGFLVYQNTIQAKELKDERKKREDHEAKQQELLTFQKYEMHKTAFHSMLDQLEESLPIKFYDRESLYESLFPHNSFESCNTKHANIDFLNKITEHYVNIWTDVEEINTKPDDRLVVQIITSILTSASSLKAHMQKTHDTGNLYWNHGTPPFMCNVFNPSESMFALEVAIRRISSFCYVQMPNVSKEPFQAWFLFPFYKFVLSPNGKNLFKTDFDEYKPILSILIRAHDEFQKPGWNNNNHARKMVDVYTLISKLFFDSNRLIELFSTQEEVKNLILQLRVAIEEYIEVTGGQPNCEFVQLHTDIIDLRLK